MQFHRDKKDLVSAVQNYHICQAIERAVQTFLGMESCNALWMNLLEFWLFQTFSGEKSKILGVFGLKVLALTNSFLIGGKDKNFKQIADLPDSYS